MLRPLVSRVSVPPQLVSELINHSCAAWKVDLVRRVFLPMDAQAILAIPLCTSPMTDHWAWHYERKGSFSVRSAYRMLSTTKRIREGWIDHRAGSSGEHDDKGWTNLWKLSVPSKLKVFLWRLARLSLPSADLLHRRNMSTSCSCSICGASDSWRHSLLDCRMSRCVWALCEDELAEHVFSCAEPNAKLWLFSMQENLSAADFTRVVVTIWAIWTARRKAIHEEIFQSPLSTFRFVNSYIEELSCLSNPT